MKKVAPPSWRRRQITHRVDGWVIDRYDEDQIALRIAEVLMPTPQPAAIASPTSRKLRMIAPHNVMKRTQNSSRKIARVLKHADVAHPTAELRHVLPLRGAWQVERGQLIPSRTPLEPDDDDRRPGGRRPATR